MKKQLLLLFSIGFLGCQPKDEPLDVAGRVSGAYAVQFYIVDGDTLYSINGKNKLGVNNFYVSVGRKASDTLAITYARNVPNSFVVDIGILPITGTRIVHVDEVNGIFQLSGGVGPNFIYESSIDGNKFYERTTGFNTDSIAARIRFDSLKSPYNPPIREIIISAQK